MIRVCLDSNVRMAAFAARSLCSDLLARVLSEHYLVIPDVVRQEVLRVLSKKFKSSREALQSVIAVLDRCERAPKSDEPGPIHVPDPDDERMLADAAAAGVALLVTGDKDLLQVA